MAVAPGSPPEPGVSHRRRIAEYLGQAEAEERECS